MQTPKFNQEQGSWKQSNNIKRFKRSDDNPALPENFKVDTAIGGGDCFFDSVAKGLKQIKPEMEFTAKSLRKVCKELAIGDQQLRAKVINDARNSQDPTVIVPASDVSDDELWNAYLVSIEYTNEDMSKMQNDNPDLYRSLIDLKYGSTLQAPIWGRSDVEGQVICKKYDIELHVIEKQPIVGWSSQIVSKLGSRSVDDIDYSSDNIIHIVNKGRGHFDPILNQQKVQPSKLLLSRNKQRIINRKLFNAIEENKLQKVKKHLDEGADVNAIDANDKNNTLLHVAVLKGEPEIVKLLLEKGVKTDVKNSDNETPLDIAKRLNKENIIQMLEEAQQKGVKRKLDQYQPDPDLNKRRKPDTGSQPGPSGIKRPHSGNSLLDEKKTRIDETYSASGLKHTLHGNIYQLKLLMLFLKRGLDKGYSFRLATGMDDAEKFDDLVFQYENEGKDGIVYRFLQAKHKQDESKKISVNDLLTETDGEFSLQKYFISYRQIKQNPEFIGKNDELKDLVLFTNIDLDSSLQDSFEQVGDEDNILDTDAQNKRLKLEIDNFSEKERIVSILENTSDLNRLAKKLAENVLENKKIELRDPLFKTYHGALAKEVINVHNKKFHEKFLNAQQLSDETKEFREAFKNEIEKHRSNLQTIKDIGLKLSGDFGRNAEHTNLPNDYVTYQEIKDFFEKLVFAVNQPNEVELGKIIKNEIGKEFNNIDRKNVYSRLQKKMLYWMQEKEGRFISNEDGKAFFEKVKKEILGAIRFDVREPVILFTGRIEELEELHKTLQDRGEIVISQMASVTGLGGVGKSELARKYIDEHSEDYDNNVIWINAEKYETLVESFLRLARDNRLGIPTKDKDGKEKDIEFIVKEVYQFFSKRKSLFIFDNAERYKAHKEGDEGIDKFLPSGPSKPYVLITSRNQEWEDMKLLQLDVFTKKEAVEFIRTALNIEVGSQESEMEKLAETLQYLPLALTQAVAYIRMENKESKSWNKKAFTIEDYLNHYKAKAENLLNLKLGEEYGQYTEMVFTTWTITIDKIKQKKMRGGEKVLEMLNIMAYLAPDKIPIEEIFLKLISDEEELHSAVELLDQYSMANLDQGVLDIHRLVQQVIRINLKEQNKEEKIVGEAFKLLKESFPYGRDTLEDYAKKKQLLPHFEAFLSHIDDWLAKKPEDKQKIEKDYLENLLIWMAHGYGALGDPQKQKELLERALAIQEKHYGPDHFRTLVNLGIAYGALGDPQKQKELLERALAIQEKHYGPDHFEVARTLVNLGIAYGALGDPQKQKELLERTLAIQEKHYGPDHFKVAQTQMNLGIAYGALGDPQKQKELLERALAIQEKYYGPDHFEVAQTQMNLGIAYGALGDPQKQKELLERALAIQEKHYGPDHFEVAQTQMNLGIAYGALGDPQKQKELLERALAIQEKYYGPDHFEVAQTQMNLGIAYGALGDPQKQKELLERALAIQEKHYGPDHFEVAQTQMNLGIAYGALGDPQKQKELLERALAIQEKHYGPDHFEVARILGNLGNAYGALGDSQKQKGLLERALAIQEKHYGPDHFEVARILGNLGNAYGALGDPQKQKELLERAYQGKYYDKTLLHRAAENGHLDTVKYLIDYKNADFTVKDNNGLTPLHIAASRGRLNVVKCLVEKGADVNVADKEGSTPLNRAVDPNYGKEINLELVKYLVEKGANLNVPDKKGRTPLNRAVDPNYGKEINFELVKYLVEKGADVNVADKEGSTPLNRAVDPNYGKEINLELVKYLVEKGADLNVPDKKGRTPLNRAVDPNYGKEINFELVKYLVEKGADVNVADKEGSTPLHLAAQEGKLDLVRYLVDKGVDFNYTDKNGRTSLHSAAQKGALDIVKYLIEKGADFNVPDKNGWTSFHLASGKGNLDVVKYLVDKKKVDVNTKANDGRTPLYWATENGKLDVIKYLVSKGADIDIPDKDGWTILYKAFEDDNYDIVKFLIIEKKARSLRLIEKNVDNNGALKNSELDIIDTYSISDVYPIHLAAENGYLEIVEVLVNEDDNNVKYQDSYGNTALHEAVSNDKLYIVKFLIEKGRAEVDAIDNYGNTPLHVAAYKNHLSIVKFLIEENADINKKDNNNKTPLYKAVVGGSLDIVEFFTEIKQVDISLLDKEGRTLLHDAALSDHKTVIEYLLRKGLDINARDNYEKTPLHLAVKEGSLDAIKFLIEKGADFGAIDNDGNTMLHIAAYNGHSEIVQYLMNEKKVDLNSQNKYGWTFLHKAAERGNSDLVEFFIKKGANFQTSDKYGWTPLHRAAHNGKLGVVTLLIDKNADINIRNYNYESALHLAAVANAMGTVKLLLKKGANIHAKDYSGKTFLDVVSESKKEEIGLLEEYIDIKQRCSWYESTGLLSLLDEKESIDEVHSLLQKEKMDIDAENEDGETLLHFAVRKGNEELVKLLLEKGTDIHVRTDIGETSLHLAARGGYEKIVTLLLAKGANVNVRNDHDETPLHEAARAGHTEIVKLLFEQNPTAVNDRTIFGNTALHNAAINGYVGVINFLLDKKADIDARNSRHETPLHLAATVGNKEIIRLLLDKGADVSAKGYNDNTILHIAAMNGYENIVKELYDSMPDKLRELIYSRNSRRETPLHLAAGAGHKEVIDLLLARSPSSVNAKTSDTPLHYAARTGNVDSVRSLLTWNAKIDETNDNGIQAIHLAAEAGHLEVIKELHSKNAKVNAGDNSGIQPIHLAAREGHKDIVQYLLEKDGEKAEINAKDNSGMQSIHLAAREGHKDVVEFLLKKDVNFINTKGACEVMPIHLAARNLHMNVIKLLIDKNARIDTQDKFKQEFIHHFTSGLYQKYKRLVKESVEFIEILKTYKPKGQFPSEDEDKAKSEFFSSKINFFPELNSIFNSQGNIFLVDDLKIFDSIEKKLPTEREKRILKSYIGVSKEIYSSISLMQTTYLGKGSDNGNNINDVTQRITKSIEQIKEKYLGNDSNFDRLVLYSPELLLIALDVSVLSFESFSLLLNSVTLPESEGSKLTKGLALTDHVDDLLTSCHDYYDSISKLMNLGREVSDINIHKITTKELQYYKKVKSLVELLLEQDPTTIVDGVRLSNVLDVFSFLLIQDYVKRVRSEEPRKEESRGKAIQKLAIQRTLQVIGSTAKGTIEYFGKILDSESSEALKRLRHRLSHLEERNNLFARAIIEYEDDAFNIEDDLEKIWYVIKEEKNIREHPLSSPIDLKSVKRLAAALNSLSEIDSIKDDSLKSRSTAIELTGQSGFVLKDLLDKLVNMKPFGLEEKESLKYYLEKICNERIEKYFIDGSNKWEIRLGVPFFYERLGLLKDEILKDSYIEKELRENSFCINQKSIDKFILYLKNNKKLQAATEFLVFDLRTILAGALEKSKSSKFDKAVKAVLDDVLGSLWLRNYLAHTAHESRLCYALTDLSSAVAFDSHTFINKGEAVIKLKDLSFKINQMSQSKKEWGQDSQSLFNTLMEPAHRIEFLQALKRIVEENIKILIERKENIKKQPEILRIEENIKRQSEILEVGVKNFLGSLKGKNFIEILKRSEQRVEFLKILQDSIGQSDEVLKKGTEEFFDDLTNNQFKGILKKSEQTVKFLKVLKEIMGDSDKLRRKVKDFISNLTKEEFKEILIESRQRAEFLKILKDITREHIKLKNKVEVFLNDLSKEEKRILDTDEEFAKTCDEIIDGFTPTRGQSGQKRNFSNDQSNKKFCSHRRKRDIGNCLFSWEDIDQFNEEKEEVRNPTKIKIDSERFINYVKNIPEEKLASLLQLAGETQVAGKLQGLVNTLISNQKVMNHLNRVGRVSGISMHGMMGKATLASFLNGDEKGVAINLGFIAGGQGFARVAQAVSIKGAGLVSDGKLLLGRSLKAASPFLARGTSAFVVYDLVNQIKAFKNGTEEALVGAIGDGIYLGVDAAEIGIEVAEAFDVFEGVSSITGPIGAAIGAVIFVGTDIYLAVKRVDKINEMIHLTGNERFIEGLRAFIGMQPEKYIAELMEEKEVSNQLVKQGLEYLKQHSDIQRYIFPTGKSVVDSCRDVPYKTSVCDSGGLGGRCFKTRTVTRYAEVCTTKFQIDLDNKVLLDRKRTDIKWSRAKPDNPSTGKLFCLPQGNDERVPSNVAYLCNNAIGVETSRNKIGNYTFINLGEGIDHVEGFPDSPNIILVGNGSKRLRGGNKDDIFVLQGSAITGFIEGSGGTDTVDLGDFALGAESVSVDLNAQKINDLRATQINRVLARKDKKDIVNCGVGTQYVDGRGGKDKSTQDVITINYSGCSFYNLDPRNCYSYLNGNFAPELQVVVRPYTIVNNDALRGNFNYIVYQEKGKSSINLGSEPLSKHSFLFNHTLQGINAIKINTIQFPNGRNAQITIKFAFLPEMPLSNTDHPETSISYTGSTNSTAIDNVSYMLSDGTKVKVGNKGNLYAIQRNNKSVNEIVSSYPAIANNLRMSIFTQSSLNNETVAIGYSNHDVLRNDPYHKSHLVGNGGENIFVITSGYETLDDSKLNIPEVAIYDVDKENLIDTLDLRQIKQQVKRDLNKEVKAKVAISNKDLLIELLCFRENQVPKNVVKVILKDALLTNWYERLHVIIDNVPMRIEEFELKPLPLIFDESDKNIIVIGAQDIEEENRIVVSKEIGNYTFARSGNDLIITNASDPNLTGKELCTILLSEFYQEPKMRTLSIIFTDQKISLRDEINKINNAVTFADQLNKLKNVSSIIDNYSNHIRYKNSESKHVNVATNNHRQERSTNLEDQEFFNAQNNANSSMKRKRRDESTARGYKNNNDQALFYGQNNANSSLKGGQVTSGGNKLSSWIGSIVGATTIGIAKLGGFISSFAKTSSHSHSEHPTITMSLHQGNTQSSFEPQHIDLDGTILLFDLFIRKITGQNYIPVNQDVSLLEVQTSALNIIAEFEEILNSVCDEPAIDFAEAQSNIFKAMMSGSGNKIPGILCSYVEEAKLEPEVTKKILATFQPTKPPASPSEGRTKHLPYLPETAYDKPQTCLSNIKVENSSVQLCRAI